MDWSGAILLILAIEFLAVGGIAFGAAAVGLGRWPKTRVATLAVGGIAALALSLGCAYGYAARSGEPAAPSPLPAAAQSADTAAPGPTRQQMDAAKEMTPDERRAMIESMVARLADRLRDNPKDLPGWLRLARAHAVMGRREKAIEAYRTAKRHFPAEAARIDALIEALGPAR